MKLFEELGSYTLLMRKTFAMPRKWRIFYRSLVQEIYQLGLDSLPIVLIISLFIGAVITIQLAINIRSPLVPKFTIGFSAREIILLEFSSTVMCLILAGKVGSSITSELGTMRVTEQIDALEIMGVNSASFLILPKIIGFMLFIPILALFSMMTGIFGGYWASYLTDSLLPNDYIYGLNFLFKPQYIMHSITKSLVYAFLISSVSSYYGYTVKGGALQVGSASTKSVVSGSILILLFDVLLTNIMLA